MNKRDNDGFFPLEIACTNGYFEIVKLLTDNNSDLTLDRNSFTPLHAAAATGRYDIVKYLIDTGMNVNKGNYGGYTPVHWATQERHLHVVKLLVESGANPEAKDDEGFTPLYIAAEGYPELVEYLISKNVDIYVKNEGSANSTPLNIACIYEHIETVRVLLHNRADIEVRDNAGSWKNTTF